MRQTMNTNIEDERGLMSVELFKKMLFTAFGKKNVDMTECIFTILTPIISVKDQDDGQTYISISELSLFIDFFNYYPFLLGKIKNKNVCSVKISELMGEQHDTSQKLPKEERMKVKSMQLSFDQKKNLYTTLSQIASKLQERFENILVAFRCLDANHSMGLNLNEFVQGLEFLRIKLSFDEVKQVFTFLDQNDSGFITYEEFRLLDEENFRKITLESLSNMLERTALFRLQKKQK